MIEISVSCPEGKYRPADQTECISCDLGKQSNSDKTLCGEYSYRSYHLRKKKKVKTGNVKKSTLPGRIRSISSVISADVNLIL